MRGWDGHFLDHDDFFLPGQLQPEPDPETGEHGGNEPAVDLDRMLDDEEAKLDQPEHDDQDPAAEAIDECVYERAILHSCF